MRSTPRPSRPLHAAAGVVLATALSLGLSAPAIAAPPAAPAPPATAAARLSALETESRQQVIQAAEAAAAQEARYQPRPDTSAIRAGMNQMIAGGAIGVTARVDAPGMHWSGAAGLRDKDRHMHARRYDRFRVASITKTMVATLVLQEVEKGTWRLDQRVDEVIPGLFPNHREVTFRQLLSHTAGVPNGTNELLSLVKDWSTWDEFLRLISRDYTAQFHIDLVNGAHWTEPGRFSYSNAGYIALGMLLEKQNGRPLEHLLWERIWWRAGMWRTSLPDSARLPRTALREDANVGEGEWVELDTFDPDVFLASGAGVSTTADLSRFVDALFEGHLVDKKLVAEMTDPRNMGGGDYALGLYRVPDPCVSGAYLYGHDGASFGTVSIVLTSPDTTRRVALAATGRPLFTTADWSLGTALQPMLRATCGR